MKLQVSVTRSARLLDTMLDNNEKLNLDRSLSKDQKCMHLESGMFIKVLFCGILLVQFLHSY